MNTSSIYFPKAELDTHPRLSQIYNELSEDGEYKSVSVRYCTICGHIEFLSKTHDGPEQLILIDYEHKCPRCEEIYRRTPELFKWISGIFLSHNIVNHGFDNTKKDNIQ